MTLPKTALGLAVGVLLAAAIGWWLEGAKGLGVFLGFLLGAGLAGIAVAWQAHCLQYRPERVLRAQMEGFAIKLGSVAVFAVCFRYFEPLSRSVNWQTFLFAFAAAALLVMPLSTIDLSHLIAAARARRAAPDTRRTA